MKPFVWIVRQTLIVSTFFALFYGFPRWGAPVLAWMDERWWLFTAIWSLILIMLLTPFLNGVFQGLREST